MTLRSADLHAQLLGVEDIVFMDGELGRRTCPEWTMSVTTWMFLGLDVLAAGPVAHWLRSPVSKSALKMTLANKPVDRIQGSEYLSSVFDVIWIVCHTGYNLGMRNTGWLHLLAGVSALTVAASVGGASQFVLFDVTFTYTKADADNSTPSKSHYYVKGGLINPGPSARLDVAGGFRNGTVHIRTEVIEKPAGGELTTWTLCYIPNRGQGNGYGCTGTVVYREKGIYGRNIVDDLLGGRTSPSCGRKGSSRWIW